MISRLATTRLPIVSNVTRENVARAPTPGRGQSIGENARGDRVLHDVMEGFVARLNSRGAPLARVAVAGAQDPITPGLVAVSDDGERALVMSCGDMHGDAALVLVDLEAQRATTARTFSGPGWVVGGFLGDKIVSCAQQLGDDARFTVFVGDKSVWSCGGMQPPCVPARVSAHVLALVVCPQPDPITLTGPTSLCALDVATGTLAPLAPAAGTRVVARDGALVVEGGAERVTVTLQK